MTHRDKVAHIAAQVKSLAALRTPVRIQKSVDSHFVPNPYDTRKKLPRVDMSSLNEILEIDPAEMTCTAESGVTFERLVAETQKHSLIPLTVPELKGITIGGAVSGCSIESMSYRYGGFHDSCLEYEVVDGRGETVSCSPDQNSELFHMIHGSYGTIGLITRIKFRLLRAKPFVRMTYLKFKSFDEFNRNMMDRCGAADFDFIDGIIHSPCEFVLCLGNMVDAAPYTSSYEWLRIFYRSTHERAEDYLRISDYLFRYDTECHWLTKTVPFLETKPARLIFGKMLLGSTNLIRWSRRVAPVMRLKRRPEVVVDVFIPSGRFSEFFSWYERDFDFYPLWIVPYRAPALYPWIDDEYKKGMSGGMFIDCAIYGKPNSDPSVDYSEILEKKTIELGGIKTLISRNHFSEAGFWRVYNRNHYTLLKQRHDPQNLFLDLYAKFAPSNYGAKTTQHF